MSAKTTQQDRRNIRARYRAGHQVKDIAADYSITPAAVSYHCADIDRHAPCGTRAGYQHHRTIGETPCDACKAANIAYCREYARSRRD